MKKNLLLYAVVVLLCAVGGFLLLALLHNNPSFLRGRNTVYATPPPTLPLARTGPGDANTKPISFPTFHVSFRVPSNLKTNKEVDPTSEDTLIGSNIIALYAPDTVINRKHVQTAGAKLFINLTTTKKKDFTNEEDIIPTTSIKEATTDISVIPANNPLLNDQNMKVYAFPSDKSANTRAWAYHAEALLKNGANMLSITFYCVDYSNSNQSPVCQKLLKEILLTMTITEQPSNGKTVR